MKTGGGTYLTHVLNGIQSERCHPDRQYHLRYPLMSWYLQYTKTQYFKTVRESAWKLMGISNKLI